MKKLLSGFIAFILSITILPTTVVQAKEQNDIFDDTEIMNAVIAGDGSEDNPYILDYSLVPEFEQFVIDAYNNPRHSSASTVSSFTDSNLTKYQGIYSNGGVWVYSSGGMSVSSDGSLRFSRIAYSTVDQTHKLYSARTNPSAWNKLVDILKGLGGVVLTKSNVASAVENGLKIAGYATIGGYSAASIASATVAVVGATAAIYGSWTLLNQIVNLKTDSELNAANASNLTFVNINYMTSYHGSWYSYTTVESGWASNKVYVPTSFYGTGNFYAG